MASNWATRLLFACALSTTTTTTSSTTITSSTTTSSTARLIPQPYTGKDVLAALPPNLEARVVGDPFEILVLGGRTKLAIPLSVLLSQFGDGIAVSIDELILEDIEDRGLPLKQEVEILGGAVEINICKAGKKCQHTEFLEPVILSLGMPENAMSKVCITCSLVCVHWNATMKKWVSNDLQVISYDEQALVCTTTHASIFSIAMKACAKVEIFAVESFINLFRGQWFKQPCTFMLWGLVLISICFVAISLSNPLYDENLLMVRSADRTSAGPAPSNCMDCREFKMMFAAFSESLAGVAINIRGICKTMERGSLVKKGALHGVNLTSRCWASVSLRLDPADVNFVLKDLKKAVDARRDKTAVKPNSRAEDLVRRVSTEVDDRVSKINFKALPSIIWRICVVMCPWTVTRRRGIRGPLSAYVMLHFVRTFGTMFVGTFLFSFFDDALSASNPSACESNGAFEVFGCLVAVCMVSKIVASFPAIWLSLMVERNVVSQCEWKNHRASWKSRSLRAWIFAGIYVSGTILFMSLFLANVSSETAVIWLFMILMTLLLDTVIVPVVVGVLIGLIGVVCARIIERVEKCGAADRLSASGEQQKCSENFSTNTSVVPVASESHNEDDDVRSAVSTQSSVVSTQSDQDSENWYPTAGCMTVRSTMTVGSTMTVAQVPDNGSEHHDHVPGAVVESING